MNIFEFHCVENGDPRIVHVVAENVGEAMIEFRNHEQFEDWHVDRINQIKEKTVVDLQKRLHSFETCV